MNITMNNYRGKTTILGSCNNVVYPPSSSKPNKTLANSQGSNKRTEVNAWCTGEQVEPRNARPIGTQSGKITHHPGSVAADGVRTYRKEYDGDKNDPMERTSNNYMSLLRAPIEQLISNIKRCCQPAGYDMHEQVWVEGHDEITDQNQDMALGRSPQQKTSMCERRKEARSMGDSRVRSTQKKSVLQDIIQQQPMVPSPNEYHREGIEKRTNKRATIVSNARSDIKEKTVINDDLNPRRMTEIRQSKERQTTTALRANSDNMQISKGVNQLVGDARGDYSKKTEEKGVVSYETGKRNTVSENLEMVVRTVKNIITDTQIEMDEVQDEIQKARDGVHTCRMWIQQRRICLGRGGVNEDNDSTNQVMIKTMNTLNKHIEEEEGPYRMLGDRVKNAKFIYYKAYHHVGKSGNDQLEKLYDVGNVKGICDELKKLPEGGELERETDELLSEKTLSDNKAVKKKLIEILMVKEYANQGTANR